MIYPRPNTERPTEPGWYIVTRVFGPPMVVWWSEACGDVWRRGSTVINDPTGWIGPIAKRPERANPVASPA